jgi:hypothetical protein
MENLVALAKRRGFIFQSSEIYGGFNGFFDYGPLGAELKKNIRDCWWNDMVRRRDDVVERHRRDHVDEEPRRQVRPRDHRLVHDQRVQLLRLDRREERHDDVDEEEAVEEVEVAAMWFDFDLPEEPSRQTIDTTSRVWADLDRLPIPLDGEPHDAWWDERQHESTWVEP